MFGHNLIRREEYINQHIRNPKVRQNKQCFGDTLLIFCVPKSQMVPGVAGIFRVARSAPVAAAGDADVGAAFCHPWQGGRTGNRSRAEGLQVTRRTIGV